jgi:3-hydroxyisobutyrate dehydrogenase
MLSPLSRRAFATGSPAVGFVGLGNMGGPMARNLAAAGHHLTLFDVHDEAASALAAEFENVSVAGTVAEVAQGSGVVVTMLPATPHVESVYLGASGLLESAAPGTLFIDSSTIAPQGAQKVGEAATAAGMSMVDAPVSGGVMKAQLGTLTFMVGGEADAYGRALPYLQVMGENLVHVGASGNGQVAKVCNNMAMAINMAGCAEAMNLAIEQGLDPKAFHGIINSSSGELHGCWPVIRSTPTQAIRNAPATEDARATSVAAVPHCKASAKTCLCAALQGSANGYGL